MHEVMTDLMIALWSHLRPNPIQFGKKVHTSLPQPPLHSKTVTVSRLKSFLSSLNDW